MSSGTDPAGERAELSEHTGLNERAILEQLASVRIWRRGDERAPHKPLLLLVALSRLQQGQSRLMSFAELEQPLQALLDDFGPPRRKHKPEQPFWRLEKDGIWELHYDEAIKPALVNKAGPSAKGLREHDVRAGLSQAIWAFLTERPDAVNRIAADILDRTFPASMHHEVLDAIGFPWVVEGKRKRDPHFREHILRIYEHRCAFCGYDGRLGRSDLGIEAAHVRWHAHGGPDTPENGLALCSFHHKVFDRGALSISDDLRVLVSQHIHGQTMVNELMIRLTGTPIRAPQSGQSRPALRHLAWHRSEVFRAPARNGT